MFITEHAFELPKGYVDADGNLHRQGVMRLATAADEILPLKDPRVKALPAYLIIILLSRVVIKLGTLPQINPAVIEGLLASDLAHLQAKYNSINDLAPTPMPATCPRCAHRFSVEVVAAGEFSATP